MKNNIGNEGFTLIEVLIASVILVIGLVALLQLISIAVYGSVAGRDITVADNISKRLLEDMNNRSYRTAMDNMTSGTVTDGTNTVYVYGSAFTSAAYARQPVTVGPRKYYLNAQYTDNTPSSGLSTVRVYVNWTTTSHPHTVSFTSYFDMS